MLRSVPLHCSGENQKNIHSSSLNSVANQVPTHVGLKNLQMTRGLSHSCLQVFLNFSSNSLVKSFIFIKLKNKFKENLNGSFIYYLYWSGTFFNGILIYFSLFFDIYATLKAYAWWISFISWLAFEWISFFFFSFFCFKESLSLIFL